MERNGTEKNQLELNETNNDIQSYSQNSLAESTYFDVYSSHNLPPDVPQVAEQYSCPTDHKITEFGFIMSSSKTSKWADASEPLDMKSGVLQITASDDDHDDLFECGICTENLKIPKSLPCLHNFCLECLEKYLSSNNIHQGQNFNCPTCRAVVIVPEGGPKIFPTNFHIVNLRRRNRELDMGQTIKEAVHYLESRAEEIVDEMSERKRQVLIAISKRRCELVTQIEDLVELLLESVEEQYGIDSTKSVETISAVKDKLSELQTQLEETYLDAGKEKPKQTEAIQLNALTKLRRQAEIIANVNNELEELKQQADHALTNILDTQLAFCHGECPPAELKHIFGKLVLLTGGQTVDDIRLQEKNDEGFSPLHVKSWSQSWWVLVFAVLPAIMCTIFLKVILIFFEKLLG